VIVLLQNFNVLLIQTLKYLLYLYLKIGQYLMKLRRTKTCRIIRFVCSRNDTFLFF